MIWTIDGLLNRGWIKYKNRTNGQNQALMLCPLCDFYIISDGTEFWHITGIKTIKGVDHFSLETISGIIPYGIWVS